MTELTEFQRKLSALLPDVELRFEEALAKHTSFRIGGDAEVMAFPKTKIELADILKACAKLNCKCAARAMVTPAITRMWVSSSRSMPPRQSFRQTTSPRTPSSG